MSDNAAKPVVKIGPIAHIGLVVEDCHKAMEFYSRVFGIEFGVDDYDMSTGKFFNVEGKPEKARFRAAFGQAGNVAIELVQVLEGETPHTKFLREHGEGLQHICFQVDDMEATMAALKAEGFRAILDYEFETASKGKRSRVQEVYLNTNEHPGGATIQLLKISPLG